PSTVGITGLKITDGNSPPGDNGGGVLNQGTLSLGNCVITGNTSDSFGGGVASNFGPLTITNSTISSNNAQDGGGVAALLGSSMVMTNSTVSSNTSANTGGGLDLVSNTFSVTNCTISGNTSGNTGGGIYHAGSFIASSLTVTNCTVTGNSMRGIKTQAFNGGSATTTVKNTLVADNSPTNFLSDSGGVATSMGNNLDNDGSSGFTNGVNGDIVAVPGSPINAKLGPLVDYGGPAPTRALLFNSPAINAGSNTGAPATDERGLARPVGPAVDIGAFEFNVSLNPMVLPAGTRGVAYSQTITPSGGTA